MQIMNVVELNRGSTCLWHSCTNIYKNENIKMHQKNTDKVKARGGNEKVKCCNEFNTAGMYRAHIDNETLQLKSIRLFFGLNTVLSLRLKFWTLKKRGKVSLAIFV